MSKSDIIDNYRKRFETHGPGPEAVQYADRESHFARFEVIAGVDPDMASVLDIGCGLGDFCHFLRARGNGARYHGVDIVPEFIELATKVFEEDDAATVTLLDAELDALPGGYDYAVLSGVFNNAMEDNWGFMTRTLRQMWQVAEKGISFNAMSTHVDYRDPDLFYVDPMQVFTFCKAELGGHPVLRHDYSVRPGGFPFEFAVYVYKSPRDATPGV